MSESGYGARATNSRWMNKISAIEKSALVFWERKKLKEWKKRGILKPDGSLKVGPEFCRKRRGKALAFTATQLRSLFDVLK